MIPAWDLIRKEIWVKVGRIETLAVNDYLLGHL